MTDALTAEEAARLAPYVTDLEGSTFALTNLPEVVKGALFARYSRSPRSVRRLLLDEFLDDLEADGAPRPTGMAVEEAGGRAARLYDRVFLEYGDDSVAQLGGAHVAVEGASNVLTKVLERGRLAAYLEQSTRYIAYDDRPGGRWRYHVDADVAASPHVHAYREVLDASFRTYADLIPPLTTWARRRWPQPADASDAVYRSTIRAKVCDLLRGLLPAATTSNVGIFASGQAYEALLLRLRSHELAEARAVGDALLRELRKVIPSFLTRVDLPDRGGAWERYLAATRDAPRALVQDALRGVAPEPAPEVDLRSWSPATGEEAELELVAAILGEHAQHPEAQLRRVAEEMAPGDRQRLVAAYAGERRNRRHRPGRALERLWYRFDVCGDYGAFRDLQRHRMLTITWQDLTPLHGYEIPADLEDAGLAGPFRDVLERQADLWARIAPDLPAQAAYVVGFAYRIRYSMQLNARAAMQLLELRTTPQGHPSYRRVCQRMHERIRDVHPLVADLMVHVDHGAAELERLDAERAAEARRAARAGSTP